MSALRRQPLISCRTDQHSKEPQVHPVIFIEPGAINMQSVADKAQHGVVCSDDQDQQDKGADHHPSENEEQSSYVRVSYASHKGTTVADGTNRLTLYPII